MYGYPDNYGSPNGASDAFGDDDLDDIDAVLDADDEDDDEDEYGALLGIGKGGGVLGIALGEKAQKNKIERILGKLKKFYEQGKLDKAERYAKSLSKVNLIQKKGYTTPEIAAWVDFAETGDEAALSEALEGIAWTGDTELEDDEGDVQGEVYDSEGGQVRKHHGSGRKLPAGFRPRGYALWGPAHKSKWLRKHPHAASIRLPIDPGRMPGRGRRGGGGSTASSSAGVRGGPPLFRAPRTGHPFMRAAYRAGKATSAPAPYAAPAPRPVASAARPVVARPFQAAAYRAGATARPGLPGVRSSFRAGRASRYGLDEAIEEGVQEFGAMIGADAFRNLQGRATLPKSSLFEDDMDDEMEGIDSDEDLDTDDSDEFGAYISSYGSDDEDEDDYGAYVPQFGAVFKRDIEDRLEAARRAYETARTKETDPTKVQKAFSKYQSLVRAYKSAAKLPGHELAGETRGDVEVEGSGFSFHDADLDDDPDGDDEPHAAIVNVSREE